MLRSGAEPVRAGPGSRERTLPPDGGEALRQVGGSGHPESVGNGRDANANRINFSERIRRLVYSCVQLVLRRRLPDFQSPESWPGWIMAFDGWRPDQMNAHCDVP